MDLSLEKVISHTRNNGNKKILVVHGKKMCTMVDRSKMLLKTR